MIMIKTKYWIKSAERASGLSGAIRGSSTDECAPGLSLQGLHKISTSRVRAKKRTSQKKQEIQNTSSHRSMKNDENSEKRKESS